MVNKPIYETRAFNASIAGSAMFGLYCLFQASAGMCDLDVDFSHSSGLEHKSPVAEIPSDMTPALK